MKKKSQFLQPFSFDSPEFLELFRKAADAFDAKHTKSKAAARKMLVSEGIYTKSGKLTKNYR